MASYYGPVNYGRGAAPGTADKTVSAVLDYLGPPHIARSGLQSVPAESFSLNAIYADRVKYFPNTMSDMVKESSNAFITTYIMPLAYEPDLNFMKRKLEFSRTPAPQVPLQAPAPYVKASVSVRSWSMDRHALSVFCSLESLKTEEGQAVFEGGLANAAVGFREAMELKCFGAIFAACKAQTINHRLKGRRVNATENPYAPECVRWDAAHKYDRGIYSIIDLAREELGDYIPTDAIISAGMRRFVAEDPAEREYYRAGPGARAMVIQGADALYPNLPGGLRFHAVRPLVLDDGHVVHDPLARWKTIGDHFRLDDFTLSMSVPAADYTSAERTINVFDMSVSGGGDFGPVSVMDSLRHGERFDLDSPNGDLLPLHDEVAADVPDALQRLDIQGSDRDIDPFFYRKPTGDYGVCRLIGQQEPGSLSEPMLDATADTLLARILQALGPADVAALRDGLRLAEDLRRQSARSPAANAALGAARDASVTRHFGAPNITGGAIQVNGLPVGYGSLSGIRAIGALAGTEFAAVSGIGETVIARAAAASRALERLHASASTLLVATHPAIDPDFAPEQFRSTLEGEQGRKQDSITALVHNLLEGPLPALVIPFRAEADAGGPEIAGLPVSASVARNLIAVSGSSTAKKVFASAQAYDAFEQKFLRHPFSADYAAAVGAARPAGVRQTRQRRGAAVLEDGDDDDAGVLQPPRVGSTFTDFLEQQLGTLGAGANKAAVISSVVDLVERNAPAPYADREALLDWLQQLADLPQPLDGDTLPVFRHTGLVLELSSVDDLSPAGLAFADPNNSSRALFSADAVEAAVQGRRTREPVDSVAFSRARLGAGASVAGKRGYSDVFGRGSVPQDTRGQPAFFDALFREPGTPDADGTSRLILTPNLADRFARAFAEERDPLRRMAIQLVLLAPICLRTYEIWYRNHVRLPIAVLAERPNRLYRTISVPIVRGGAEFGVLAYNGIDIQVGTNTANKTATTHISMWIGPIIFAPEMAYLATDAFVCAYGGGENLVPYSARTFRDQNSEASVLFLVTGAGTLRGPGQVPKTHSLRGRFPEDVIESRMTAQAAPSARKLQYSGALYYDRVYGFSQLQPPTLTEAEDVRLGYEENRREDNVITHQAQQFILNPVSKRQDMIILATDHFGNDIYPGHGLIRCNQSTQRYKPMNREANFIPVN